MRVSSVQEALNGHSNDTVITPYTLNQVLDTLPSGGGGGGITEETDPIFKRSAAYGITSSDIDKWNNNTGGGSSFSGDYNDLTNKPDIPDSTSDLVNDSGFITAIPGEYVTESELNQKGYLTSIPDEYKTKSENDALYQPKGNYLTSIPDEYITEEELNNKGYITQIPEESDPVFVNSPASDITDGDIDNWNAKQEPLVSGQNIKTINNQSLLGSGNITITSGGGGGTSDYNALENLPSINGTTLVGDKSLDDLGVQPKGNYLTSIPTEYVTETELASKGYITSIPSNYITDEELNSKGYLTSVPSEYITETELNQKGYLTEHQDISGKQDVLISGTNIKTINNESILGSGNISISGGSAYTPQIGEVVTFSEMYVETLDTIYQEGKTYYSAGAVSNKFGYIHPTYTALVAGTDYNVGDTIYKAPTDGSAIDASAIVYEEKNPALYYGGEWSLIDKMFYNAYRNGVEKEEYTRNSTNCTEVTEFYWLRSGHTISIAIRFTNKVQIAGTNLEMFTIDYKALGTTRIYRIYRTTSWSDLAGCLAFCSLHQTTGVFTTVNIIPDNYISAGRTDNSAQITINVAPSIMLDECCDRFIWKRVA